MAAAAADYTPTFAGPEATTAAAAAPTQLPPADLPGWALATTPNLYESAEAQNAAYKAYSDSLNADYRFTEYRYVYQLQTDGYCGGHMKMGELAHYTPAEYPVYEGLQPVQPYARPLAIEDGYCDYFLYTVLLPEEYADFVAYGRLKLFRNYDKRNLHYQAHYAMRMACDILRYTVPVPDYYSRSESYTLLCLRLSNRYLDFLRSNNLLFGFVRGYYDASVYFEVDYLYIPHDIRLKSELYTVRINQKAYEVAREGPGYLTSYTMWYHTSLPNNAYTQRVYRYVQYQLDYYRRTAVSHYEEDHTPTSDEEMEDATATVPTQLATSPTAAPASSS